MGFGDPYHKHPLIESPPPNNGANCSHCELPIIDRECYGCPRCDYYIHKLCGDLPVTLKHTLHDQHPLTLLKTSPGTSNATNYCYQCRNPCINGFTYHCLTCRVIFHLKCLFSLKHDKHEHPLIFSHLGTDLDGIQISHKCNICGFPVIRFNFSCMSCEFYIHHECSLIPSIIKHRHVHELTIRHNFPDECDQVYCDLCEDRDNEELDRALSYYYCKRCDYIGHLHCCLPPPKDDVALIDRYTHEHPLRLVREHPDTIGGGGVDLHCDQCGYVVRELIDEYPSLIKHPRHPEHNITFAKDNLLFKCTVCDFFLDYFDALQFKHPYFGNCLTFCTSHAPFRCNVCGELGKGSRMTKGIDIDFHLECFALPGKFEHKIHQHTLYLSSNPAEVLSRNDTSTTSQHCVACKDEIDIKLGIYRCLDCAYIAHVNCVASDLLSSRRSSIKNQPYFCAIIEPDESSFELQIAQTSPSDNWPPSPLLTDLEIEGLRDVVCCPRCHLLISTQAKYS